MRIAVIAALVLLLVFVVSHPVLVSDQVKFFEDVWAAVKSL